MTTPPGKIAEEKTGNLPILAIGGGGTPYWEKTNIISVLSFEGFPYSMGTIKVSTLLATSYAVTSYNILAIFQPFQAIFWWYG